MIKLKQELFALLDSKLVERGFKFYKSRLKFRREIDDRVEILKFTTVDWPDEFYIVLEFEIRFESMEIIKNDAYRYEDIKRMGFSKSDRKWTCVGSCESGVAMKKERQRLSVSAEADLKPVVRALIDVIDNVGDCWFEKFNSVEKLLPYLLTDDQEKFRLVNTVKIDRFASAIVATYLLGRGVSEVEHIVSEKRPLLLKSSKLGLTSFDNVVNSVRELSSST